MSTFLHLEKRRNSLKRIAPYITAAISESNKDNNQTSKPLVIPHRRASVISRMVCANLGLTYSHLEEVANVSIT
jgi:hypothetical protein